MATTGTGYRRVSKKRPCYVCGKPDWCSITASETISFCARSTLNANRISRHGWGVFYHAGSIPESRRSLYDRRSDTKPELSELPSQREAVDWVYRTLIELSPATSNDKVINGKGGLLERGIHTFSGYGSLPKKAVDRDVIVDRLKKELGSEFGAGANSFKGIPGFWRDNNGRVHLWSEHDISDDLLLIPFIGKEGNIQACQIRFMEHIPHKSGHYVWLSSFRKPHGSSPGSPLHHANPSSQQHTSVLVTEGALKAATVQNFLLDRYVVGNSGVGSSHREIVETARYNPLEIAFDNDSFTNPHVARALAGLVRMRYADQRSFSYNNDLTILTWNRSCKGIDEALLAGHQLKSLTVDRWLGCLSPECFEEASQQLSLAWQTKER